MAIACCPICPGHWARPRPVRCGLGRSMCGSIRGPPASMRMASCSAVASCLQGRRSSAPSAPGPIGRANSLAGRSVLVLALLTGAAWGGWTAGRFKGVRITGVQSLKSLVGGVLMGWGTLLIPGSNDGLILVGMPLLWPYAWVAFLAMCLSIAGAKLLAQIGARPLEQAGAS